MDPKEPLTRHDSQQTEQPSSADHAVVPVESHTHRDGKACVRTGAGRWLQRGAGLGPEAECMRFHPQLIPAGTDLADDDGEPLAEWERELQGVAPPNRVEVDEGDVIGDLRAVANPNRITAAQPRDLTVTMQAEDKCYGNRQDDYGHPRQTLTRTAVVWTGLLHDKLADGEHITPDDVARLQLGSKLARDVHEPKRDNRVDMAGYALTLDRLETGQ